MNEEDIKRDLDAELKTLGINLSDVKKGFKFIPSPGPQTEAYFSKADILLFGGEAGGGKSGLLLGLALNEHERSLIVRSQFTDLGALTDELVKFYGTRDGFVSSPRPKLSTENGQLIEFGALSNPGDEFSWQGRPHDFYGFDEGVQLREEQIRFLIGWNRSTKKGQRCRVVIATNPPVKVEGEWIINMFAPWLDPTHINPAKPGELRWFITNKDGKDQEVGGPEHLEIEGRIYRPMSRTFIRSKLSDNPYLSGTGYESTLDAMPEPYRSAMRDGNFMLARREQAFQMIPTQWVMDAVARWKAVQGIVPPGVPMCAIGADVSGGGDDPTSISRRFDYFFDKFIIIPGKETKNGEGIAGPIMIARRDNCFVTIDMGGGYGNVPFKVLRENLDPERIKAFKGAETSTARTRDGMYGFTNKRTEGYWKFRELLDPTQTGGSPAMLPDDREMIAELIAPTYEITARGIKMEPKEEVAKKLGRSSNKADSLIHANFNGARGLIPDGIWDSTKNSSRTRPPVMLGYANRKHRRG